MNISFKDLKKNRQTNFEKLSQELEKASGKVESFTDDRFWYPEVDKVGNGYAVIRFLPAPPNEDLAFVRVWEHGFKGPTGSWYIEKSLTTLGKNDPVSEYNTKLWNTGLESDKEIARKQKRRLTFISNILVIEDSAKPENNGKVFLFKYGKKIFDKLYAATNPEFPDEKPFDPYDFWDGANFKLKIRNVEGYRNYDKSEFSERGPLSKDEEELEKIWKKEYPISDFINPKNFKSYSDLQERLNKVLGLQDSPAKYKVREEEVEETSPPYQEETSKEEEIVVIDEDEDDSEFFKKLAE